MPDANEVNESSQRAFPNPELATESDYSPPRGNPFPIVGVGASAGGIEAFTQLLSAVPANTGFAFVLVQHLDPQHDSLLTEILTPATKLRVQTVHDGIAIQPDHVYVIPPNATMELQDGHLRLVTREPGLHLPIDIFFRSLAQVQGSRGIGVVLSGNASDGSIGVRAIKAECGITFAQDEATARFGGMPRNAIATGAVDYVLAPADIGRELGRLGQHRFLIPASPGVAQSETLPHGDGDLKKVLALLHSATKVDFGQYKPTTIQRRIGRRMIILRVETLAEYVRYLMHKPAELGELYKDLLISVTSFFRDPETFEAVIQYLQTDFGQRTPRQETLRLWVPGCATGEEVYSLAIRLQEFIENQQLSLSVQIFGTDISEPALEHARQGLYDSVITDAVSEVRLRRFFTKMDGRYQINKMVRECCVFARHDLTKDPPFSRLDIVSCRNVLIYFDTKAQRKVLPAFHYALNPTGLLMLGSAETTAAAADLFTVVDKVHHLYGRRSVPTRLTLEFSAGTQASELVYASPRPEQPTARDLQRRLEHIIQARYSPNGVVVSGDLQILQFKGHTAPYLDPIPGEAGFNLLRMVQESLVVPLRRAIHKAVESDMLVRDEGASIELNGRLEQVAVEVTPIALGESPERYFLIVFNRTNVADPPRAAEPVTPILGDEQDVHVLRRELADTREHLRNVREEYEAHAEELRAANEEARSANEELQSTNEELGTTKEELQSANEELTTVNEELQNRNRELASTNSDLRNFLSSVTVAVLMVDNDLRVRRFNTAAEKLLELGPVDIGRPVGHLRGRFEAPRLEDQIKAVIESLNATAEEVPDVHGNWYAIGVRPYRTVDERIAGAVVTFQDIDPLKRGLEASEEAREYAESLIETVREPLVVLDADLRVQKATPAFYQTFLVSREETEGRLLYDLGNGQWNKPRLRERLGSALFKSEPFHDFEVEHDFPHVGRRTMRLNARRIPRRDPRQRTLLLAIEDTTERREVAEMRFQRLFETAKDGIVVIDAETETVQDVNSFFLQLTGFAREDFAGKNIADAGALLDMAEAVDIVTETRTSEIVRYDDLQINARNGSKVSIEIVANRYSVGTQPVVQFNIRDISGRREAAKALRESEERFRIVVESVHDYAIFQVNKDGKIITWNTGAERLLGWEEREVLGKSASLVFTPEDIARGEYNKELDKARIEGRSEDERWHIRKNGSRFFATGVLTRSPEGNGDITLTKVMQDITSRKEQDDQLRRSLEEKSVLVREIHHRVKNNLQMLVSLLSLQANHSQDRRVMAAFEEIEGRVRAIARIHEQLYTSEDLATVEVGGYLADLARELVALHARLPGVVQLTVDVEEMTLHIEKAIPVGMIANELILNSLKHGLQSGTGNLTVAFKAVRQDNGSAAAQLCVQDSGPGFPPGLDLSQAQSMGYRLVNLLLRQLSARWTIGPGPGASITVEFPISKKSGVREN